MTSTSTTSVESLEPGLRTHVEFVLDRVIDGEGSLATVAVVGVEGDVVSLEVESILVDNGGVEARYELPVTFEDVEVGDGGAIVVLFNLTGEPEISNVGLWDSVTGALRSRSDPLDLLTALSEPSALDNVWDPPENTCGVAVDRSAYEHPMEVVTAYLDGDTPRQKYVAARDAMGSRERVEELLGSAEGGDVAATVDEVSQRLTPLDENFVFRQLAEGVDEASTVYQTTVPTVFDVSGLKERLLIALLDLEAGRLLGHTRLSPDKSSGVPGLLVSYMGRPDPGHDVTVVTVGDGALVACSNPVLIFNRLVEPGVSTTIAVIPYDDFAGGARLRIDVATGSSEAIGKAEIDAALGR